MLQEIKAKSQGHRQNREGERNDVLRGDHPIFGFDLYVEKTKTTTTNNQA